MYGKVCLITGATSGIGQVTAHALAQQGATVIMVGRDAARSAAAVDHILHGGGDIDAVIATLLARPFKTEGGNDLDAMARLA